MIAIVLPDKPVVLPTCVFPLSIAGNDLWIADVKLPCDIKLDTGRYLHEIGQEGSQKAGSCELKGNSQPVMPAPTQVDESKVSLIKMKIPGTVANSRW